MQDIVNVKAWHEGVDDAAKLGDVDTLRWINDFAGSLALVTHGSVVTAWLAVRDYAAEALAEAEADRELIGQEVE